MLLDLVAHRSVFAYRGRSPAAAATGVPTAGQRADIEARQARQDSSDQREAALSAEPTLAKDPTLRMDAADPIDPIDSTEPTEPMESTDPCDHRDRTES